MQLIECPWCGPREEVEFHYGGQAHVPYPDDPGELSDEEWAHYVFFRDNTKGRFAERWNHSVGCRRWFNAIRDTATYRFERVYRLDDPEAGDPMTSTFRTPEGGRIDRATTVEFTFDGQTYTGHPGDTLASALLAAGRHQIATSIKLGRPRGIAAAWAEDPGGLVQIEEPFPEPMLLATTVELYDGLVAHGLPGQGRLAEVPDSARYDAVHHHVDVLVVGAGPAGLAAALTAARAGARVALVDEQSEAGGSLLSGTDRLDDAPALQWVAAAVAELAGHPEVLHLQRTTAFGSYDDGFVLALERRTDHLGAAAPKHLSRQRVWRLRARSVVVATGAHERPVVFADNDRPGIMLAGAARTFLHRYGVLPGREAVVFTTNDSAYDAALDLHRAGVRVQAVVDARPEGSPRRREECERAGIRGPPRVRRDRHARRRAGHARARRPVRRRRRSAPAARSPATCSWSAGAGTPRCTCSARPAAGSATTRPSARSSPGRSSTACRSPARPPVCSTWPGAWPTGSAWPARP